MSKFSLHIEAYEYFRKYLDETYREASDRDVLGLSTGYPEPGEFPLPKNILRALRVEDNGIELPRPGYGWNAGSTPVRKGFVELENLLHGTNYSLNNICMVAGASYAFNRIAETIFLNEDGYKKNMMIIGPTYYRMLMRPDMYATLYSVVGREENDFQVTAEEVLHNLLPNTKAIFMANPTNPTYLYFNDSFFEALIPELEKRKIFLIIDESGDAFNLGVGKDRLKRFPQIIDNPYVIRIVTASKKYLFAEYRIGYVLGSEQFMGNKQRGFIRVIGDDMGNAPLATNLALAEIARSEIKILHGDLDSTEISQFNSQMNLNNKKMIGLKELSRRLLSSTKKVARIIEPQSNFNITFKIASDKFRNDMEFFSDLLEQTSVSLLPCSGTGIKPDSMYFRLTYGINQDMLTNGLTKLIGYLERET